jgi:hypothetical protein
MIVLAYAGVPYREIRVPCVVSRTPVAWAVAPESMLSRPLEALKKASAGPVALAV